MPWTEVTKMESKREFVLMADQPNANISRLCRRFGISRPTGYKWLARYRAEGFEGLAEHSRRPHSSPHKTPDHIEQLVLQARRRDPGWGGRKLHHHLRRQAKADELGVRPEQIPAPSTITDILGRHGMLAASQTPGRQGPWERFERKAPNQLWQMDFKGEFRLNSGNWCYPLTIIDDHSRFAIATQACPNQRRQTVKDHLQGAFGRYGLPEAILCDNGAPWGSPQRFADGRPHYTQLAAWLLRLDITVSYSRPGHPQSKGKNERFNGSLDGELLRFKRFADYGQAQDQMSNWRSRYNTVRPHEALDMASPASHYRPSPVALPEHLPPIEYGTDDHTRKVSAKGIISFRGQSFRVGKAFKGQPVAVRPRSEPNEFNVYFCNHHIRTINLTKKS